MKKIIIGMVLVISAYFGSLAFLQLDPYIQVEKAKCVGSFQYEEKQGVKIVTMKNCGGYEAGYFHGQQLEKEIKSLVSFFKDNMLGRDKYFGRPQYAILQHKAKEFVPYIPEYYLNEMQGIADGAGVSFNEVLLINTYDDLLQIAGCSSMIVPKETGRSDSFVHTRNLDYPIKILAQKKVVLLYDTHMSVGFPGYIGVLTGIGEKGLSLSTHTAYSKNKAQFGIPSGLLYRNVLSYGTNIAEARSILQGGKRTIANNVMIGSYKENTGIVAELDSVEISDRSIEGKDDMLVSTNHFRTPKMKKVSTNSEGTRYSQYFDQLAGKNKLEFDDIKKTVQYYEESSYWKTISNNGTVQSVIMYPEKRKVFVANGENIPVSHGEYVEIDF